MDRKFLIAIGSINALFIHSGVFMSLSATLPRDAKKSLTTRDSILQLSHSDLESNLLETFANGKMFADTVKTIILRKRLYNGVIRKIMSYLTEYSGK